MMVRRKDRRTGVGLVLSLEYNEANAVFFVRVPCALYGQNGRLHFGTYFIGNFCEYRVFTVITICVEDGGIWEEQCRPWAWARTGSI